MNRRARTILWLDGGAGGFVGLLMLALCDQLVWLYQLPRTVVIFIAAANLTYAAYSVSLATLASLNRPLARGAIDVLLGANLAWAVVCLAMIIETVGYASIFGLAHVALEGFFVATLAASEYRLVRPWAH